MKFDGHRTNAADVPAVPGRRPGAAGAPSRGGGGRPAPDDPRATEPAVTRARARTFVQPMGLTIDRHGWR